MTLDPHTVRQLFRCSECRSALLFDAATPSFVCSDSECRRQFPVRDEIPVMLLDESTQLTEADWQRLTVQYRVPMSVGEFHSTLDSQSVAQTARCPRCLSALLFDAATPSFVCSNSECRRQFPVRDDIPVMLSDESTELPLEDWQRITTAESAE